MNLSACELEKIEKELLVDPVAQRSSLMAEADFDWLIEVGYKPGVTDNVGRTTEVAIGDLLGRRLGRGERVYTSTSTF